MQQGRIEIEGERFSPEQIGLAFALDNVMSVVVLQELGSTTLPKMVIEVGHYDNRIGDKALSALAVQAAEVVGATRPPRAFRIVEGKGAIASGL